MRWKRMILAVVGGLIVTAVVQQFTFDAVWWMADQFSTADWQNWHFVFAVITLPGLCFTARIAAGGAIAKQALPEREPGAHRSR